MYACTCMIMIQISYYDHVKVELAALDFHSNSNTCNLIVCDKLIHLESEFQIYRLLSFAASMFHLNVNLYLKDTRLATDLRI